jgi:GNAT superfamily N-acetyltransferase
MIEVELFSPAHAEAFARLNREWIERLFSVEAEDERLFADPAREIVDAGGQIFFAIEAGRVLGTAALIVHGSDAFELAKMAVTPAAQGRGIGRLLMNRAIDYARGLGKRELMLITNSALTPALTLYRSVGFERLPDLKDKRFARGDVEMVLHL